MAWTIIAGWEHATSQEAVQQHRYCNKEAKTKANSSIQGPTKYCSQGSGFHLILIVNYLNFHNPGAFGRVTWDSNSRAYQLRGHKIGSHEGLHSKLGHRSFARLPTLGPRVWSRSSQACPDNRLPKKTNLNFHLLLSVYLSVSTNIYEIWSLLALILREYICLYCCRIDGKGLLRGSRFCRNLFPMVPR